MSSMPLSRVAACWVSFSLCASACSANALACVAAYSSNAFACDVLDSSKAVASLEDTSACSFAILPRPSSMAFASAWCALPKESFMSSTFLPCASSSNFNAKCASSRTLVISFSIVSISLRRMLSSLVMSSNNCFRLLAWLERRLAISSWCLPCAVSIRFSIAFMPLSRAAVCWACFSMCLSSAAAWNSLNLCRSLATFASNSARLALCAEAWSSNALACLAAASFKPSPTAFDSLLCASSSPALMSTAFLP
mmetsp:Transcript_17104/g.31103  ORF Transcript_17104/g.31103 Transcript_17104/m.31103 type:complete len:252 (-) Transcript_17104:1838-2593(-)